MPQFKIMGISGQFAGPMLRAAERLGAEASLAKPVLPDELQDAVARVKTATEITRMKVLLAEISACRREKGTN